jgi:hypothetical protein
LAKGKPEKTDIPGSNEAPWRGLTGDTAAARAPGQSGLVTRLSNGERRAGNLDMGGSGQMMDSMDQRRSKGSPKCVDSDQLQPCDFLGFIAANPIPGVEMLAPKRAVVRDGAVVMVENALLVIAAKHG